MFTIKGCSLIRGVQFFTVHYEMFHCASGCLFDKLVSFALEVSKPQEVNANIFN